MKIMFIINSLNTGGAERALLRFLKSKIFCKDETVVVSLLPEGDLSKEYSQIAGSVIHLSCPRFLAPLCLFFSVLGVIRKHRPDVIHSWLYQSDLIAGLSAKMLGCSVIIWSIRQSNLSSEHNKLLTRVIIKFCAVLSNIIPNAIVSNSHTGRKAHENVGYSSKKITVIPNGYDFNEMNVDPEAGARLKDKLKIPKRHLVVGMVARYDSQKGLEDFCKVAALLSGQKADITFVLCGHGLDRSNEDMVSLIECYGIGPSVRLCGKQSNLKDFFNLFDLMLSTSQGEGFPNAIAEAIACGTVVLANDVGDTNRIVRSPENLFAVGDINGMVTRSQVILSMSKEQRDEVGFVARRALYENYSLNNVALVLRTFYQSQLNSKENMV